MTFAFNRIQLPERQSKPRSRGLTMMIDWGLPLEQQKDALECHARYVDEAKIAGSICRIMPEEYLMKKIALYREQGCQTFTGGLFTELAIAQGNYEYFLEESQRLGFTAVEFSDNLLKISPAEKRKAIAKANREFGLTVMGEVGRKEGVMSRDEIIADVESCLEAGSELVLLEAKEIYHGEIRIDDIEALLKRVRLENIMFELPVKVLPDIHVDKRDICSFFIKTFGTDVNLGNVEWDEVYLFEMFRLGAGGDTDHKQGAYRLAGIESMET